MPRPDRTPTFARACLAGLLLVDGVGAVTAARHRVAGEPFGVGGSLDPRRPTVSIFWGTGLSAPLASLVVAVLAAVRRPTLLRPAGIVFALGALIEPVAWGRRPAPPRARAGLALHVAFAAMMAVAARPTTA